jgi:hypothetical protein
MAWKPGPLPPNTWNWGGVVLKSDKGQDGFYFADFCGDHVMICPDGRRVEATDIALYDNGLTLPQNATGRAGG